MNLDFENISPELREKAKNCTSPEEVLELAKHEGYKLSEDELDAVSGGDWTGLSCSSYDCGDPRDCIEIDRMPADFVNGTVNGGELE